MRAETPSKSLPASVTYLDKDLLDLAPEERACEGIFLAFQYPVEIPGVSNLYFLRAAVNAARKHRGEDELDAIDFMAIAKKKMASLGNGQPDGLTGSQRRLLRR